jgi:acylphosphatase
VNIVGVHLVVSGVVQGVGFRWFVAREANRLGLTGYCRNLMDGTVEVEVKGDRSLVEELIKSLRVGPRSADVRSLDISWKAPGSFSSFEIR